MSLPRARRAPPRPPLLRRALPRTATLLVLCAAPSGCQLPSFSSTPDLRVDREVFGRSGRGRPIEGVVLTPRGADSPYRTYLLVGVVHGNEPLGRPVLERLLAEVEDDASLLGSARLVVVPTLNPDGLAQRTRTNARGVDLNRNLPARNWRRARRHGAYPASEPETRALLRIIRQFRPERILAIHSPLHCVNWDGPAERVARDMARASGYPLRASIGYPTPGSLGSYAGVDQRTQTITLELERGARIAEAWRDSWPALLAFVDSPRWREVAAGRSRRAGARGAAIGK